MIYREPEPCQYCVVCNPWSHDFQCFQCLLLLFDVHVKERKSQSKIDHWSMMMSLGDTPFPFLSIQQQVYFIPTTINELININDVYVLSLSRYQIISHLYLMYPVNMWIIWCKHLFISDLWICFYSRIEYICSCLFIYTIFNQK